MGCRGSSVRIRPPNALIETSAIGSFDLDRRLGLSEVLTRPNCSKRRFVNSQCPSRRLNPPPHHGRHSSLPANHPKSPEPKHMQAPIVQAMQKKRPLTQMRLEALSRAGCQIWVRARLLLEEPTRVTRSSLGIFDCRRYDVAHGLLRCIP